MILKSPISKIDNLNSLTFTKNARAAWELILIYIKQKFKNSQILMPSYIGYTDREGSGVFDPIKSQNLSFDFYKLNNNLTIDLSDFEEKIKKNKYSALLVIHYFGFCRNDMNHIKYLCKENNIILIEDCAHHFNLFESNNEIGNYGDFIFYSIHKFLPTFSGGILKSNLGINIFDVNHNFKIDYDDLELYSKSDYKLIVQKRRKNFELYFSLLISNSNYQVLYDFHKNDIAHSFPLLIKNGLREKLYFYLMELNIPTIALYYRMISEIKLNDYPISHEISNQILNLPLHQDTEESDIYRICKCIKDFYTE